MRSTHTGRLITCAIYRDAAPGVEVRAGFSTDDVLQTQRAATVEDARIVAEGWLAIVVAKGGYEPVTPR